MNIDELKPGRELDALVAEKIFGDTGESQVDPISGIWQEVPEYSTDIAAAWDVVEKSGILCDGYALMENRNDSVNRWIYGYPGSWLDVIVASPTAPHAICLAALKAVGYEPE